jgi:hypothetical protein
MFKEVVAHGYDSNTLPDYLSSMKSPMRKFYPTEKMKKNELLTLLTEVVYDILTVFDLCF